jgi:hypothetical protein
MCFWQLGTEVKARRDNRFCSLVLCLLIVSKLTLTDIGTRQRGFCIPTEMLYYYIGLEVSTRKPFIHEPIFSYRIDQGPTPSTTAYSLIG